MNTQHHTVERHIFVVLLLGTVLAPLSTPGSADDSYQQTMLFNPSQSELNAEARGRVMIYDRLDDKTVERALDTQFERIDRMMFTRVQYSQDDEDEGKDVVVDDDGC